MQGYLPATCHGLSGPGRSDSHVNGMQDFSGFRIASLFPRYKPCYPAPSDGQPQEPPYTPAWPLGAPNNSLPALMVGGKALNPPFKMLRLRSSGMRDLVGKPWACCSEVLQAECSS